MQKFFLVLPLLILLPISSGLAQKTETQLTPVAMKSTDGKMICQLAPENTSIEFVGTHVGDDPKPRLGGFKKFSGKVEMADGKPVALKVDMEITSLWTEFDNLTKHLMNADFFEAEKFPKSQFESTEITLLGDGNCIIKGKLTLHGTTSDFEFPAKYKANDKGIILTSEFTLDRTQFGMDKMTDGVEAVVTLDVVVGKPTRGVESKSGNGSESGGSQAQTDDPATEGETITISLPAMT